MSLTPELPIWVAEYVGIPWLKHGRTRAGCDCYGLIYLVYQEVFDIALPSYAGVVDPDEQAEVAAILSQEIPLSGWEPVPIHDPRELGDAVVMRIMGEPWHVGLVVSRTQFLHAQTDHATVVDRLDSFRWLNRVAGLYRHSRRPGGRRYG